MCGQSSTCALYNAHNTHTRQIHVKLVFLYAHKLFSYIYVKVCDPTEYFIFFQVSKHSLSSL